MLAVLIVSSGGCAASGAPSLAGDASLEADVLAQADRAFAADTAARGLAGWLAWFTPGAAKLDMHAPPILGRDAIAESDGPIFADPSLALSWEPDLAEWIDPGQRGFTRGAWTLTQRDAQGVTATVASGRYLTLWILTEQGWRAELDVGVPDA
jgi:ketosteroid isomerase-like protein